MMIVFLMAGRLVNKKSSSICELEDKIIQKDFADVINKSESIEELKLNVSIVNHQVQISAEHDETNHVTNLMIPKKEIMEEIASANFLNDTLNTLKDETAFIRVTYFQIALNLFLVTCVSKIIHGNGGEYLEFLQK